MKLFSKNGEELDLTNYKYLDKGEDGEIYIDGNTALKLYYLHERHAQLTKKMFNILKNQKIPNIVKLHEYLYTNDRFFTRLFSFDAYTMDYINGKPKEFISFDKKIIIEMLKSLEQTLQLLTDCRIVLHDVHPKNLIITENGMTIIDLDRFYFLKLASKKTIYRLNKLELLNCINSTILKEVNKSGITTSIPLFTIDDNLSFLENTSKGMDEKFEKILSLKK